jgi:nitrite reductase/ring-hydroxylating ferredoxin subunit
VGELVLLCGLTPTESRGCPKTRHNGCRPQKPAVALGAGRSIPRIDRSRPQNAPYFTRRCPAEESHFTTSILRREPRSHGIWILCSTHAIPRLSETGPVRVLVPTGRSGIGTGRRNVHCAGQGFYIMSDLSRRHFLQVLAAGAATTSGTIAGCSGNNGNNGDPEPFGDVTAGNVTALEVGTVKSIPGAPAFIGRDNNGLYAMTTTCTHAGCDMASGAVLSTRISCYCHSSLFSLNGDVQGGPANKPLTHFAVELATDGTVTVHGGTAVPSSTRVPA